MIMEYMKFMMPHRFVLVVLMSDVRCVWDLLRPSYCFGDKNV